MPEQTQSAASPFAVPLGLCAPIWPAYGLFVGASLQWWALSQLARFASPVWASEPKPTAETPIVEAAPTPAPAPEPITSFEATPEPIQAQEPVIIPTPSPPEVEADDFTRLRGVGPRLAQALAERGVTRFHELAAWSEEQLDAFDAELKLLGRAKRFDFVGQARTLASEA